MRYLVLCIAMLWPASLAAQSDDRGFIQGLLEDALSSDGRSVELRGFAGALSARATIEEIIVSDPDGVWLRIADVAMVWNRRALLSGAIDIEEISVGVLDLARLPVSEASGPEPTARAPFALPDLPVSVVLKELAIAQADIGAPILGQAVRFQLNGSAELAGGEGSVALTVDRLDAGGRFALSGRYANATREVVLDLDVAEPEGGLAATLLALPGAPSVALTVNGAGPLSDLTTDIALATDGEDRLTGQVGLRDEASADGTTRRFSARLEGDISPLVAPQFREFLGSSVELVADGSQSPQGAVSLSALDLRAQAFSLAGTAEISAGGWPDAFDLDVIIAPPDGESVLLPLPGDPVFLGGADLRAAFDARRGDAWTLKGTIAELRQPDVRIDAIALDGSGRIARDDGAVDGAVQVETTGMAFGDPALQDAVGAAIKSALEFFWAQGQPLQLRALELSGADYGITGNVTITGLLDERPLTLTPDMRLTARDISRFSGLAGRALGGAADLDIKGRAEPVTTALDLQFEGTTRDITSGIAQLDPLLEGTGRLQAQLVRDTAGTRIENLVVNTEHAEIAGRAAIDAETSRVDITARLPDISRALPQLSGTANADIDATRAGNTWQFATELALPGSAALAVTGAVENLEEITANIRGRIGDLTAYRRLAGRAIGGAVALEAQASGNLKTLAGNVTARLDGQSLSAGIPAIAPLLRGASSIDLVAARADDGTLRIDRFAVDTRGAEATASGTLSGSGGDLQYAATLTDLGLLVRELSGPARVSGTARGAGGPWQINASGTGPGGITLSAEGSVAPSGRVDLGIDGAAPLALANAFLSGQTVAGQARFDLRLAGRPGLDALSGQIALERGRVALPAQRLAVENIDGTVRLASGQAQLAIDGDLASGGDIRVAGPIGLSAPFPADLSITLDDTILRDPDLYEADADGTIRVQGPLTGGAQIGGAITLDVVELRIPNIGPSYSILEGLEHQGMPADVRQTLAFAGLLGQKSAAPAPSFPIDLLIRAPAKMFVRGRGLDAELGGQLRLTGTTNDIVPVGQFDLLRGRIDLLGRRLTLTEGAVSLQGSFDPIIRFVAETEVDGTAILISIEGPASEPEPIISSVPELPEDEVLSLYLFGRSVEQISPLQAVRLAAALRTLSGRGGLGLTDELRSGLGVDDLSIGTDAEGNATAEVGAYITEDLYTDVTVNSRGDSEIKLNLDLTDDVTVRGRVTSQGETGLGIFFERDY
ncbi:translocation/assembly module TamB domain-containing protein [Primorskyibacter sp. S187A]|uniref:translocation/assembly module TamB domain-containing protein n=1 Tax=Primorskyibacter sp. S187A TaxID=3415130 RepID=UPI003C7BFF33